MKFEGNLIRNEFETNRKTKKVKKQKNLYKNQD